MAETLNTRGIVLHYEAWRDYDRRYVLYTEQLGKVHAKAIGVRKSTAKLAGVLEPWAELELYLIIGKTYTIGGGVVMQRFHSLGQDKSRQAAVIYCSELMDRLTKEHSPDVAVYQLWFSTLTWLDHAPYSKIIPISFAIKLINCLGYQVADDKLIRWLTTATLAEIQKLRLDQVTWQTLYQQVHLWLYDYLNDDVQSEQFLV